LVPRISQPLLEFFADLNEIDATREAPIVYLDGIQPPPAALGLTHESLVDVQSHRQLLLREFRLHSYVTE
jgi:hypothetical protein